MRWFKELVNKVMGKEDKVKFIAGTPPVSQKTSKSMSIGKPQKTFDIFSIKEPLLKILKEALDSNMNNLFFDPEETRCYLYYLTESEIREIRDISLEEWNEILPHLRETNNKTISLDGKNFLCGLNIALTNLGERVTIMLLEPEAGQDGLKEEKRMMIRAVNKLKPATAPTHQNVANLVQMIELRKEKPGKDIFDLFLGERIMTEEEIAPMRSKNDYHSLLKQPFPRKQIIQNVALWLGADYFDVEMNDYDITLAGSLPGKKAKELKALIFEGDDESVKVALVNPFDNAAIKEIEEMVNAKVIPFMACEEDIRYELEKIYEK